jgi:hypothetical protein
VKKFTLYFTIQFILYALICWNIRAVAEALYPHIALSDFLIAAVNFKIIRKIAKEDESQGAAFYGYICGGMIGSICSVWFMKHVIG